MDVFYIMIAFSVVLAILCVYSAIKEHTQKMGEILSFLKTIREEEKQDYVETDGF